MPETLLVQNARIYLSETLEDLRKNVAAQDTEDPYSRLRWNDNMDFEELQLFGDLVPLGGHNRGLLKPNPRLKVLQEPKGLKAKQKGKYITTEKEQVNVRQEKMTGVSFTLSR